MLATSVIPLAAPGIAPQSRSDICCSVAARPRDLDDQQQNLRRTLQRELGLARRRVEELAARRLDLERQLEAARDAEQSARQNLTVLETLGREAGELPPAPEEDRHDDGRTRLAGAELREAIARVALRQRANGRAVHWRQWLTWLRDAGFDAAGKNAEATFQTQLARSPLIRRTEQEGIYRLDVARLARGRDRFRHLHEQLLTLPPPDQLALLGDVRAQRQELQNEIARTERAVEEIWRVLAQERPPGWHADDEGEPERIVEAWMAS
jgi:hypothetical protein